jgi:hypothetical protein
MATAILQGIFIAVKAYTRREMSPINGLIYLRNYKLNIKQEEE